MFLPRLSSVYCPTGRVAFDVKDLICVNNDTQVLRSLVAVRKLTNCRQSPLCRTVRSRSPVSGELLEYSYVASDDNKKEAPNKAVDRQPRATGCEWSDINCKISE